MDLNNDHIVAAAAGAGAPAAGDGGGGDGVELIAGDNNAMAGSAVNVDIDEEQDADASNKALLEQAVSILQHQHEFPLRTRNKIIELARTFVDGVRDDVQEMITDTRTEEQGYTGLDSNRDTEKEVATALEYYPQLLSQRHGRWNWYPIQCITSMIDTNNNDKLRRNVKAVSFVHLFVRLAIEFNSFEENLRGGLLIERGRLNHNTLHFLVHSSHSSYDEPHHQRVDEIYLAVLIRLRQSGYFEKEDIQQYQLVLELCMQTIMAQRRFRFLVDIDPSSLTQTDHQDGRLPFHRAACGVRSFRSVCDAVFCFYPKWRGIQLLHQKDIIQWTTPFQWASNHFGHTNVAKIVEETFARYSDTILPDIPKALILAATDERIHLDCVYFLLKRQPDVVLNMLPRHRQGSGRSLSPSDDSNNTNCNSNSNNNDDTRRILRRSNRKRKRNYIPLPSQHDFNEMNLHQQIVTEEDKI